MTQAELDEAVELAREVENWPSLLIVYTESEIAKLARAVLALSARIADLQSELKVAIISRDAAEEWNAKLRKALE